MELNFFSWNVESNNSTAFYSDLNTHLLQLETHILVLIECSMQYPINQLSDYDELPDFLADAGRRYVRIFTRKNTTLNVLKAQAENSNKMRMVHFKYNNTFEFTLAAVHFYSKVKKSASQQNADNLEMKKALNTFEQSTGNYHTIVVGDFNYLPFEVFVQDHNFLNALGNKALVKHIKGRSHQKQRHPYFYNPMWNLLGDYDYLKKTDKVSGTYYWYTEDVGLYHWNLIDGMVISQTIMERLLIESLEIVTQINNKDLVCVQPTGIKESYLVDGFSDHLPIKFSIKTN